MSSLPTPGLVSDIGIPSADGYNLMRTLQSWRPEDGGRFPALVLTEYASAEDRGRALAAGYQRHLADQAAANA